MQTTTLEGFELSPFQTQLWRQQFQKGNFDRALCALQLNTTLDRAQLRSALANVISRHEILRTSFPRLRGRQFPLQVIAEQADPVWREIDLTGISEESGKEKVDQIFREERDRVVDLTESSLFHVCEIRLSGERSLLLLSFPSLGADLQTLQQLTTEISWIYSGNEEGLVEDPLQYVDYCQWHQELLETEDEDWMEGRKFWQKCDLSGWNKTKVPFAKSGEAAAIAPSCQREIYRKEIAGELMAKLTAMAEKNQVSIATVLLSCWSILIHRLTAETKITIGTVCDGRSFEDLNEALGLFARTLPIAVKIEPDSHWQTIAQQVERSINEAGEWQDYFTREDWADTSPDQPLVFPIGFEYGEWFASELFTLEAVDISSDRFHLKLTCLRTDHGLTVQWEYNPDQIAAEAVGRMAGQFQRLLETALIDTETPIKAWDILSPDERQKLLWEFSQTGDIEAADQCIHQLFAEQVQANPNAIAVVFEDQQLTYAQLNDRAEALAFKLQQQGVQPDRFVALCLERSLETIIGMIGILKAGGAYIPIDPVLPAERIAMIVADTKTEVLVTQPHLVAKLPTQGLDVLCLDSTEQALTKASSRIVETAVKPHHLAYVIFTSGSTGKPKGVEIEHRHVVNYTRAISRKLDLPKGASFGLVSTFAADLGNTAIFPTLCNGGTLHIISHDRATDPDALADYLHDHPLDCLKIAPPHLDSLLNHSRAAQLLPQQRLILGGDVCRWELIAKIRAIAPQCQIFNHYGPTEATIGTTVYPISDQLPTSETVPIGYPLDGAQVYILNSSLQPVPIALPGELYIGGSNVARGYLNREELTQENFIVNPFLADPGNNCGRLYKTGDLARFLEDGAIEFLGRSDHQVKIRGFRVELGEIETALVQHPQVRETVVVARERESGDKSLVAYVIFEGDPVSFAQLRDFLEETLPEQAIPGAFVTLDTFPLTANGKVDRKALPAPEKTERTDHNTLVPPRTPTEEQLVAIWSQVLGIEGISIEDNFFALGGDSISIIQVVAEASQVGLQLTPKQLVKHQTIETLASVAGTISLVQSEQGAIVGDVPLTPIQRWFFQLNLPEPHHFNQSVLLEVSPEIDPDILARSLEILSNHHDALRLRFEPEGETWRQVNVSRATIPLSVIDLSHLSEEEQPQAITQQSHQLQRSLNLTQGPLIRAGLFKLGEARTGRLLLVAHHLGVDGISWRILVEDLVQSYEQISRGEEVKLPRKTSSFKAWAEAIQEYGRSLELAKEWDYWLLPNAAEIVPLPVEQTAGGSGNTVQSSARVMVSLDRDQTQALLREVPQAYNTQIEDILLSSLLQSFNRWTGAKTLWLELEGHGRQDWFENIDLSRTVGWFTAKFPLLLQLSDPISPGEAIKSVKEQLRRLPENGAGYSVLRYASSPEIAQQLDRLPTPEVSFNYLGQFDQTLKEESVVLKVALEGRGNERSANSKRHYLLEINAWIVNGTLECEWIYSQSIHRQETIASLAQSYLEALQENIEHCLSPEAGGYTPSDFSLANLDDQQLNKLSALLD
jgi:amino acid adenylation domain-containing protein/non-ribosomal peptide synthase protein (TIGR01720 family)